MNFLRRHFYIFELSTFAAWGILIGLILGIFLEIEPDFKFFENLALGLYLGFCFGIMLWLSWRGLARFLWNIWGNYRWFMSLILSLGLIPFCLFLLDLNAKLIISRYYSGDKPIPYTFIE